MSNTAPFQDPGCSLKLLPVTKTAYNKYISGSCSKHKQKSLIFLQTISFIAMQLGNVI